MKRKYLRLLLIPTVLSGLGLVGQSALADEATPAADVNFPPDPGASTGSGPSAPETENSLPPDPQASTGAATTTVPAATAPPPPKASGGVNPGPLEADRQAMLENIKAAEELGVGVGGYMAAFKFMEEEVAGGATEETVQKRLDSLRRGLTEQLERKQALKERPAASAQSGPVPNILMPAQDIPPSLRFGGAGGSLASPELAKQLSEKYGNKLPPGMSTESLKTQWQNPQTREMVKEKLRGNPQYMDLIKQFLNK